MSKKLLTALAAAALLGAGCFSSAPTTEITPSKPTPAPVAPAPKPEAPTPTPAAPAATTTAVVPPTAVPSGYVLPTIDATWLTYANKAKTFSFRYPTKGKYAPTWGVKYVSEKDPAYKDGCYFDMYSPDQFKGDSLSKVTINGTEFCHASMGDGFAGGYGFVDTYTTKVGNQIVSIEFEKIAHGASACMDTNPICKQAVDQGAMVLSYQSGAYALFFKNDYESHLDQIVGTFQLTP